MAEDYDLTWEKHNEASFRAFLELRGRQSLVDVSLYCEGELVRAHKLVLAACSLYFERLFNSLRGDERHRATVVALPKVDVAMLKLSLDFMYSGKVTVPSEKLEDFMSFAEFLEIRGLKTEPGASSPSPSPSGAALPRAPNGNAPLHGGLRQVNAVFGSKKPAPSSLSPATPASAAASSAAAGGGGGGGGGAKKSVKRPLPDIRPAASASPAAPGKGAVPAAAAVDPLAPTSSSGPSKAKKEAKMDVGSGAALVKAELGDDTEEGEGDYDAEDFEESYENYEDSMVMAQLGSEEDSTVPKNIPPSIVPDGRYRRLGKFCWAGHGLNGRIRYFCAVCTYSSFARPTVLEHETMHDAVGGGGGGVGVDDDHFGFGPILPLEVTLY